MKIQSFSIVLLLLVSGIAQAMHPGDMGQMETAPLYSPCKFKFVDNPWSPRGHEKYNHLSCTWSRFATVDLYDHDTGRHGRNVNNVLFACSERGVCIGEGNHQGYKVGTVPGMDKGSIAIYHYVDKSSDGHWMAYRFDQGPRAGKPKISYMTAAEHLVNFYYENGASEKFVRDQLDLIYQTGADGYDADLAAIEFAKEVGEKSVWPWTRIKDVYCMDLYPNQCYINDDIAIHRADLPKYLKLVDPDEVDAEGGSCYLTGCHDKDGKVVGVNKYEFE